MSENQNQRYEFEELAQVRGGRMFGRVKLGKGEGREFVALEVSVELSDRELSALQNAVKAGKRPYINLGTSVVDLRGDAEAFRRMIALAENVEAKLDAKALSRV